ncbi:C2H2-type zinc finger transcription factor [Mucor lusitanicus]|uniref:C2H2-type zinc finger transcription factor n=1 Tax=Mucor lusitanicus CBS 277.49 TaxID=747725 RepID=A0A168HMQ7_MUCCL|nr:C2H2-type zinc finger transcription factor [Mucor lusitanicus CBS 277.49]
MKLRARKKSFPSNIKQEDCKPTLSNAQSSTNEVANTSTFDLTIKQEDSKDHKVSLEQHDKFGSKGYYYRCDICYQRLPNLKSVLEHRESNHISNFYGSTTMAKNLDKEPDLYNPDFYCKSCEKGYRDRNAYRGHLRKVHYMVLKPLRYQIPQKTNATPDPNDPNHNCKVCNFTYKRKSNYKDHCRYVHGLNPAEFVNQASPSSSLTNLYCQTCDKRFSSSYCYRLHLFVIHKVDIRQILQKQKDTLPNVNDPNNYCRACQKTYSSKGGYRAHLRLVHQMILPLSRVNNVNHKQLPDPYNHSTAGKPISWY